MSSTWKVLGHTSDLQNAPHVILLNYIQNNWNLSNPPAHVDNVVHGVKFGQQWSGYHDLVVDCELVGGSRVLPMSLGGSDYLYSTEIRVVITVLDYSAGGITYPQQLTNIYNYLEQFFRLDPSGLESSEGINAILLTSATHNINFDRQYDQQMFIADMYVDLVYAKATTLD